MKTRQNLWSVVRTKVERNAWRKRAREKLFVDITGIIATLTKFSILIGSARAYLLRYRRVITWVSNNRYPIWTTWNWTPTPFARQSCKFSWVLSCCFSTVSYNRWKILQWLFSNRPRALRSADLKLLARLLPELYSTQSYYYYKSHLKLNLSSIITWNDVS